MKFFFDASISFRVAQALMILRPAVVPPRHLETITHLTERFTASADDYDWLNTLAHEGGWVVLSEDVRLARSNLQRKVWQDRPIVVLVLKKGWKGMKLWDRAWRLIRFWPDIVAAASKADPGSAHEIAQNGKLSRLF